MHTLVGFLLNMTQFNKPALSIADHIQIFKDRGLTITDEVSALFCLSLKLAQDDISALHRLQLRVLRGIPHNAISSLASFMRRCPHKRSRSTLKFFQ